MVTESVELLEVDRGQTLQRAGAVELIEWIGRALVATVQEAARVRVAPVVRYFSGPAIEREKGRGRCRPVREEAGAWAGDSVEVEDVRLRPVRHATKRENEIMKRD